MGILKRINRAIRGNLNELIDKMTDPAKEVDLLIVQMQDGLREAKAEVISASAQAKQAERRVTELDADVARWQSRAEQAVRAGDDELARKALQQKRVVEQDRARAKDAELKQLSYVEELKEALRALDARLTDAQLRQETIKQRARATKQGGGKLAGGKAFEQFDQLEGRLNAMEEAAELVQGSEGREAELDARFARMERENPQVDDELAELKRRL